VGKYFPTFRRIGPPSSSKVIPLKARAAHFFKGHTLQGGGCTLLQGSYPSRRGLKTSSTVIPFKARAENFFETSGITSPATQSQKTGIFRVCCHSSCSMDLTAYTKVPLLEF